ncbi:MAG: GntR family transcriptional regulator [Anaerolineae bacterium]|nr:GntR family transcriptional regulator [Anaerolineae bacterium]
MADKLEIDRPLRGKSEKRPTLQSLAEQVYEHLRHNIINGELKPGDRLVELDIAAQMGTSQGPVREALKRLEYDGLVLRQARSATFVTAISTDEMYEIFEIRSVIEGIAIHRTALCITSAQCDELQGLVEAMRSAAEAEDMTLLVEYDLRFHQRICKWSGSPVFLHAWNPLYNQIQRFVVQTHRNYFRNLREIADTHQVIVDVLRQGDADAATSVIKEHVMLIWSLMHTRP